MRNTLASIQNYVRERRLWASPVVILAQTAFIAAFILLTVVYRMSWRPDNFFLFLGFFFFLTGRGGRFVRDWLPFLLLLISYDALRGFADDLNSRVVSAEVVALEKALFGSIPTVELQRLWAQMGEPRWLLVGAIALYSTHFLLPLLMGLWLWVRHREHFRAFTASLLVLSYAGFITFLLMPVMPPWMAMDRGYLPGGYLGVTKPVEGPVRIEALPTLYRTISPNPVAAVPSLHAAYAWLAFLWARRLLGRRALPLAAYPLAVWVALVFLADHYVVDILAGLAYTHVAYFFVVTRKRRAFHEGPAQIAAIRAEGKDIGL